MKMFDAEDENEFLRASPHSLKAVVVVAVILRAYIVSKLSKCDGYRNHLGDGQGVFYPRERALMGEKNIKSMRAPKDTGAVNLDGKQIEQG